MAKITEKSRELFAAKMKPYKELVDKSFRKEKDILLLITKDSSGVAYKKLLLARVFHAVSQSKKMLFFSIL